MSERPSNEIVLMFGSAMIGAFVISAPVSLVEMCLVWTKHFDYKPFAFMYALLLGSVTGAGARLVYCWNRHRK